MHFCLVGLLALLAPAPPICQKFANESNGCHREISSTKLEQCPPFFGLSDSVWLG